METKPRLTPRLTPTRRAVLGGLAACAPMRFARAACVVTPRASIPLTLARGLILVPVEVNGVQASFILDTGAARSVVTEAAVQRLGLERDQWVGTTMSGVGGIARRPNAKTRSFSLGGIPLMRRTLSRDTSLTVAEIPSTESAGPWVDGLLGRDYLSVFDLDVHVPARRLGLYMPEGCSGRFLPWTEPYVVIPTTQPMETALLLQVEVDGVKLRGLLDTGANVSVIAAPGMYRLGLDRPGAVAGQHVPVTGVGPNVAAMQHHAFRTMRIGSLTIDQPRLLVAPIRLTPVADMLLGCDWMLTRRVWISYATRQVFVATQV
ncbi:MAG: retroviral-like aspartic protease family protein [Acetobacteraceae bacterium]